MISGVRPVAISSAIASPATGPALNPYVPQPTSTRKPLTGVIPITGENFRKEMLAIKTFDLPLTGKTTLGDDHTVVKPVYLMEVKGGKWTKKAIVGP